MKRAIACLATVALVTACKTGGKPKTEPSPVKADEPPARSKIAAVDEADRLGPTVGKVTATSAWVWLRRFKQPSTRLAVKKDGQVVATVMVKTSAERDWTGAAKIEGLEPASRYRVEVVGGGDGSEFVTAPAPDVAARVRFVRGMVWAMPQTPQLFDAPINRRLRLPYLLHLPADYSPDGDRT